MYHTVLSEFFVVFKNIQFAFSLQMISIPDLILDSAEGLHESLRNPVFFLSHQNNRE